MIALKLRPSKNSMLWKIGLASIAAIAPLCFPSTGLAQNQSDVTGPNLSDITGPNLSDVTGPNISDNTGVLGEQIFGSPGEQLVSFTEFFQDFFDEFEDELGIDPNASLAEKLRQAKLACSDQFTRRFARNPGENPSISPACAELSRLLQLAQESLDRYNQSRGQSPSVRRRIW